MSELLKNILLQNIFTVAAPSENTLTQNFKEFFMIIHSFIHFRVHYV